MRQLEFAYPEADLVLARGAVAGLRDIVERLGATRALVVSGANVSANQALRGPIEAGLAGRMVGWFDGLELFMTERGVFAGVAEAERLHADVLVAVGGGSTIDGAKSVAALAGQALAPTAFIDRYRVRRRGTEVEIPTPPAPKVALVAVPTTLAGAEWNGAAGVLRGSAERVRLRGRALAPRVVVYDPEIVATTPINVLRATAMNALDHGVEIHYARSHDAMKDAFALGALRELAAHAVPALGGAIDLDELGHVLLGSALAAGWMNSLLILERRGHGVNHALGHVLSTEYGLLQGEAHAIVMPHGMAFVREVAAERLATIGATLGGEASPDGAIARVIAIRDGLAQPSRLRERLPDRSVLPSIAAHALGDFSVLNAPRDVSVADLEAILEAAW